MVSLNLCEFVSCSFSLGSFVKLCEAGVKVEGFSTVLSFVDIASGLEHRN